MAKPTFSVPPTPPLPFQEKPQLGAGSSSTHPRLAAAASDPSQNPSRRREIDPMLLPPRKRGFAAAAGGGEGGPALPSTDGLVNPLRQNAQHRRPGSAQHRRPGSPQPDQPGHTGVGGQGDDGLAAALLDALGLGTFARLDLPAPPEGLDLAAAVDPCSGCIVVSLGGASIVVAPLDLSTALSLPLGTVELPAEVDPAVFSSAEAIAAVRAFVHDRLLLGGTEDSQALPEETAAALRLVETGQAYSVDWGWLVWAFLRSEVLIGKRRRCGQFLLRLMRFQRPDLFSEVDGRFLGKRRKGTILQQEGNLLHGNGGNPQLMAAEAQVEDGSVFGLSQNTGELEKRPAFGCVKDQQHTIGTAVQDHSNNVNVAPSVPSFLASRQHILADLSDMENALLDKERTSAHTLAEIQRMKEEEKEKDDQIAYLVEKGKQELQARVTKMSQLEHDKMLMGDVLHGYKKMLHESSSAFLEYKKMMCQGGGVSSLDAVADEKSQARLLQQQRGAHKIINGFQKTMFPKFVECTKNISALYTKIEDLNDEVESLKDPRSLIDLNVGPPM